MTPKKVIYIVLGCLCLALGVIGVYLPILPTTPFLLATLFFFANSSEKLHEWFLGTKLDQKHLESFVKKEGMRMQTKVGIILAVVWLAHIVYFGFFVKTIPSEEKAIEDQTSDDQPAV